MLNDGTRPSSILAQPLPPEVLARHLENRKRLSKMPMEMWVQWFSQVHNASAVFPEPPKDKSALEWQLKLQKFPPWHRKSLTARPPAATLGLTVDEDEEEEEEDEELAAISADTTLEQRLSLLEDPRDLDELDPGEFTFS